MKKIVLSFPVLALAMFCLFSQEIHAGDLSQHGQIVINLLEQGEVPGPGYSKNNTEFSYIATYGYNDVEVSSFVYHSGIEENTLPDGTLIKGSYGKIEESIKINLGGYGSNALTNNYQVLINLNQISETRNDGIFRFTEASAGNWQTIDVSAYLQGCRSGEFSSAIEGNSVVFRSQDGKFVGGETQSGGRISSNGLPFNYQNEGRVAITNQAKVDQNNFGLINASSGYITNTPGISYGARAESYLDLYQGKNFRGASATVKTFAGQKPEN